MLADSYAIKHAISEGLREYDFLAETSDYKERLAKKRHEIVWVTIRNFSPKESMYKVIRKLRELMKLPWLMLALR
jgi:predicted nucleotidyltransferase